MTETLTIRFHEYEWYDVAQDHELVRLMATTSVGTWHATVPLTTSAELREDREAFKTYVLQSMTLGNPPCEVTIG